MRKQSISNQNFNNQGFQQTPTPNPDENKEEKKTCNIF